MKSFAIALLGAITISFASAGISEVVRTEANNGNLLMENVPPIPQTLVDELNRYQNVRSARFLDWSADGRGMFVSTRFGDVSQIHRVDMPGGARQQLTFFNEPIRSVSRQPGGSQMVFTMDAGGSEFSQIFLLDPTASDYAQMLTDGESRNGSMVWDHDGTRIAYQSTRRNGSSNDIWLMDIDDPGSAQIALESPDGTYWNPTDFSPDDQRLLVLNLVSNSDSRIHIVELGEGSTRMVAGSPDAKSSNYPIAFDRTGKGFWFITDVTGDFRQLAWQSLELGAEPVIITGDISWHVEDFAISEDRSRAAFTVNENGFSRLYLMDTDSRQFAPVEGMPTGLVSGLEFNPDGSSLAMTLSTPQTPDDSFVLGLEEDALAYGELTRWTFSEVGGLDTTQFAEPELVRYPTFDSASGGPDAIPAWVYRPAGDGPHPVIIAIHGGPEGQARPSFSSTYQMWVQELGAAVIRPNVRGSNGYGKQYMGLDNGFNREDSVRDIGALLDWVATQPDLDQDRVVVFGGSYGGYMVLASAVHFSDRLKAAVDIVGISSFVTFLENTQDYRRDHRRGEYGDERNPAMRAHLEKISPLNNVEKIRVPMFVVQGQNDPRVPVTESEQLVEALREQGQAVWYMNALNEGHGYRKKDNRDIYQQATVLFLREHLLEDAQYPQESGAP